MAFPAGSNEVETGTLVMASRTPSELTIENWLSRIKKSSLVLVAPWESVAVTFTFPPDKPFRLPCTSIDASVGFETV